MESTRFGRTGLTVSVAGLGCGGHSRLGLGTGHGEAHAVRLVEHALALGINFIDTARAYGTEPAVGKAIAGRRDQVIVSTKSMAGRNGRMLTPEELRESLELSLRRLQTDYVDVYNLHGVTLDQYAHCIDQLLPELERQRASGKVRFVGITERFAADPGHEMLMRALHDDYFDVVMVGFNLLNPSARDRVFPLTRSRDVATQVMFAVRRALSRPDVARSVVRQLVERSEVNAEEVDLDDPLGFIARETGADDIVQAAYRFCRHEPGVDVVLTGTGNPDHLTSNVRAILAPPLPDALQRQLAGVFGSVTSVSGD